MERTGLVGNWDCVTFDEVAGMHFKDMNAIQILKGYMAGGTYARGRESFSADASLVFEGNINDSVHNMLKTTHLFDPFPARVQRGLGVLRPHPLLPSRLGDIQDAQRFAHEPLRPYQPTV